MKNNHLIFILTIFLVSIILPILTFAAKIDYPITGNETGLVAIIKNIYLFALGIVGLTAFAMIILGGILYFLSGANITKASEGKEKITNAILGLVIIAGSYLILYTINPDFVKLTEPTLPPITMQQFEEGQVYPNSWACIEDGKTVGCFEDQYECSCKNPCAFQPYCTIGQTQWQGCQPITLQFDPTVIKTSEYATMKATFHPEAEGGCDNATATFSVRLQQCQDEIGINCSETPYNYVNAEIKCETAANCTAIGLMEIYTPGIYSASVVAKNGSNISPALESANKLAVDAENMYACRQPRSSEEKKAGLVDRILECYTDEQDCTTECPTLGKDAYCDNAEKIASCEPTLCQIKSIGIKNAEAKCPINQVVQNQHVVNVVATGSQCLKNWNAELQIFKGDINPNQAGPPKYSKYDAPIKQPFKDNRAVFQIGPFKDIGQYYVQIKALKTENFTDKVYDLMDYFDKPIIVVASSTCAEKME